ncbi:MAG: hypothetical protein V4594_16670 [Bacteroidota bacterium]
MKKLLVILSLLITANSFAQNNLIWGKRVWATENLQLRSKTVTEISEDSTDASKSAAKLMTEQAIKAYIRISWGGGTTFNGVTGVSYDSVLHRMCVTSFAITNCFTIVGDAPASSTGLDSVRVIGDKVYHYFPDTTIVYTATNTFNNNEYISQLIQQYIDQSITTNNQYNGIDSTTRLISGNIVIDSTYMVRWSDLVYQVLGRVYTAEAGQVQIPPAEMSGDKKTLIFGDTLGNVSFIEGPISAQPVQPPAVKPSSQIEFVMYDIRANAPFPVGISERWIYRNPTNSWPVTTTTITGFSDSSRVVPFSDSMHIRIPAISNGQYFEKLLGSTLSTVGPTFLDLQLQLVAALPKAVKWNIVFYNDLVPVSSAVVLQDGSYGYSRSVAGSYRSIIIPWSEWSFPGGTLFNKIRITNISSAAISVYIDDIRIQNGGANGGGSTTSGIKSINDMYGDHLYLEYGDTLTTDLDSSNIKLIHKRTGRVLGSAQTFLTYIQSIDTCLIIVKVDAKNYTLAQNPYCKNKYDTLIAGTGITIDFTNPRAPVINSVGGSGSTGNADSLGSLPANRYMLIADSLTKYTTKYSADTARANMYAALSAYLTISSAAATYSLLSHNHTFDGLSNVTITAKAMGDLIYWNGSAWVNLGVGTTSQHLVGGSIPHWVDTAVAGLGGGYAVTKQFHTAGATVTISNSANPNIRLMVNPATTLASLAITFPSSPIDDQIVDIDFGGTITAGNEVVSALTLVTAVVDESTPDLITAGGHLRYRWDATNSLWYRN